MRRAIYLILFCVISAMGSGCSLMAPQYNPSIDNVQKLKDAGELSAKIGTFDSAKDPANANPISLRGSSLSSPYQASYAAYLAEALKQEMSLAGKYNAGASAEVSGVLLKNDLDSSGISLGVGDIQARFIVTAAGQIKYDQVKTARHDWESSFVGAIAIPRAQQEYRAVRV